MSEELSQEELAAQWASALENEEEDGVDPFEAAQAAQAEQPAAEAGTDLATIAATEGELSEDDALAAEWAKSLMEDEEEQAAPEPAAAAPKAKASGNSSNTLFASSSDAVFKDMTDIAKAPPDGQSRDMEFILDIPLDVSAELGRARLLINELLQLGQGSVLELNKLAGEPLEVFVNGKLVARGEAVVINEKFGVRLTDIISPMERVKQLA